MKPPRPNALRDSWCGSINSSAVGKQIRVAGWVHRRRDHGGLIFVDLRDRTGILQLVIHPETAASAHQIAQSLRSEYVISATGSVVARDEANVNPKLTTGEVEVAVDELEVLAEAETPPFPVDEEGPVDEVVRLRYRYLDLRRESMRDAVIKRHTVIKAIRDYLSANDFLDIETPIMTRSTPEGARDFLVPARSTPGTFYALPQSPQLFKQLLMVAGFERYYQIPRCFRDEDTRADRQPEFTQLDVEMSFVDEDDVLAVGEGTLAAAFESVGFPVPKPPYPRMSHKEALDRFGSDKPDTRFGLELRDVGDGLAGTEFAVFARVLQDGGVIRGLNAGARDLPRSELDRLTDLVRRFGAGGLVWAFVSEGEWRSPIAKFLSDAERAAIESALEAKPGDLLLIVADRAKIANKALGELRLELGRMFDLVEAGRHDLLWVVDFPMFEFNDETKSWDPSHHPFTTPVGDLDGDPGALSSRAYDIVLDGVELGSGSIRIHNADVQRRVFEILGIGAQEAERRFGFLLNAFSYGTPPHGGVALGLDRLVTLVVGRESIRDVIAFPKTATGADPLTGAPAPVDERQLRELGIALRGKAK